MMKKNKYPCLVLACVVLFSNVYSQDENYAHSVDFFLGEWDITVFNQDEKVVAKARSEGKHILEGTALQSDYYGIDDNGNSVFRGTTIRTFIPSDRYWVVHWAMANIKGYTYLEEKLVDKELHAIGHGEDPQGKFLERYKYFDISLISYSFEMERSYDGGKTWQFYNRLRAKRRNRGSLN